MKRVLSVALAALVLAGACGNDDDAAEVPSPTVTSTTSSPPAEEPTDSSTSTAPPQPTASTAPAPTRSFAVDDLAFDAEGALWATTGENRRLGTGVSKGTPRELYRLVDDVWQLVEQPTTVWDDPGHWQIRAAEGGGVYVASGFDGSPSPTSGVYFTDGSTWELFAQEFLCGRLAVDTEGTLWATCPDFVTRLVDGQWVDLPEGSAAFEVAAGPDGSVWFIGSGGPSTPPPVWRFDGSNWAQVAACELGETCGLVGVDLDGGAWVSRGGCGLEGLTRFDPAGDAEDFDIRGARDIAFDGSGDAWLALPCEEAGYDAGVALIDNGEVRVFTTDDGLPANDVQAVEIGPDGSVYVGTEYGVSRYLPDEDAWEPVGSL